jgi:hypothetical protein
MAASHDSADEYRLEPPRAAVWKSQYEHREEQNGTWIYSEGARAMTGDA